MIKMILQPLLNIIYLFVFITIAGISLWVIKDTWTVILSIIGGILILSAILGKK